MGPVAEPREAEPAAATATASGALVLSRLERQHSIAELAMADGRVDVGDLADRFQVTTETIRRDLAHLQEQRLVRRTHGGAVPWERWRYEPSVAVRDTEHPQEKQRIAQRAVAELQGEATLLIDSGTTTAQVARMLPHDRPLTVVTNSIPVMQALVHNEAVEVVLLGGRVKKSTLAIVDPTGADELSRIVVDLAFVGSDGVSPEHGFTTPHREEVEIKRAMLRAARRAVVLVDHSKFGNDHLHRIARVEEVDGVITGTELPEAEARAVSALGPMVTRA
ncbi:DeoR/GlpR family DNA-binding transcription regulator [Aquipuribacter sp. SD81]|uniref:DeoR/GlpR family DNA-binding transcription regulator n=1 Tax=Aquipuribacter sp. SD81 TaxID=3127703 RepID=UPI00301B02E8